MFLAEKKRQKGKCNMTKRTITIMLVILVLSATTAQAHRPVFHPGANPVMAARYGHIIPGYCQQAIPVPVVVVPSIVSGIRYGHIIPGYYSGYYSGYYYGYDRYDQRTRRIAVGGDLLLRAADMVMAKQELNAAREQEKELQQQQVAAEEAVRKETERQEMFRMASELKAKQEAKEAKTENEKLRQEIERLRLELEKTRFEKEKAELEAQKNK